MLVQARKVGSGLQREAFESVETGAFLRGGSGHTEPSENPDERSAVHVFKGTTGVVSRRVLAVGRVFAGPGKEQVWRPVPEGATQVGRSVPRGENRSGDPRERVRSGCSTADRSMRRLGRRGRRCAADRRPCGSPTPVAGSPAP